ncbi:mercuric reductase [Desulfoferrobacter suflitae]|uniref:mercuric reductase n=1 Tax=Desulfoferrobacter suflitae TaxID=2865782 RepID=UPI0021646352|nr:mercuric reductase [Desulfoferrobacter suflitae]MCK8601850.1 mercuric reductase [Desulfoferrobacter suflitae]
MNCKNTVRVLPEDTYNQTLVGNVHPPSWKNPVPFGRYNLVVIGAGTAGLVTAAGAAGLGAKVALIERHLIGGDCLNVGCVPSKGVIRASRAAHEVRTAGRFGVHIDGEIVVDFAAAMERMRRLRSRISLHDSAERFRSLGVDVYLGDGRFTGVDSVEVAGQTLNFSKAVIATGARAIGLPIEGLAEAGYLTNETVFTLTERPQRLAVVGGGPLGSELAQAFHRLGSQVSIFEMSDHLLGREDSDAAAILQMAFLREGIELLLRASPKKIERVDGGKRIIFQQEGKEGSIVVDEILLGVGRAPNVEGLGLDAAGVEYDKRSGVSVNDHLQTSNPRIYAAGDICLPYKFTHTADATARIVIQNALFHGRKKWTSLTIPWSTYTDPEVAHVGMYERDAKERGIEVDTFIRPLKEVDRAILDGQEEGFVKVHVKRGGDKILGATIVASHAGEMINEISLAMVGGLGLKTLGNVIHPYPTQAEGVRQTADMYNRTRLTPFVKKVFAVWLGLVRTDFWGRLRRYRHNVRDGFKRVLGMLKGE